MITAEQALAITNLTEAQRILDANLVDVENAVISEANKQLQEVITVVHANNVAGITALGYTLTDQGYTDPGGNSYYKIEW